MTDAAVISKLFISWQCSTCFQNGSMQTLEVEYTGTLSHPGNVARVGCYDVPVCGRCDTMMMAAEVFVFEDRLGPNHYSGCIDEVLLRIVASGSSAGSRRHNAGRSGGRFPSPYTVPPVCNSGSASGGSGPSSRAGPSSRGVTTYIFTPVV